MLGGWLGVGEMAENNLPAPFRNAEFVMNVKKRWA